MPDCQESLFFLFTKEKGRHPVQEIPPQLEDQFNLEQSVISAMDSMKAHRILHSLDEPYKEVFTLRVFGELSFRQIASLFGKTENWACVTFHRAKKKMQERMEDDG